MKSPCSARVSGACFAMGEAAGMAAALALGGNTRARDIDVGKLQNQLKQQGAFIGQDQDVPEGL
jgi:hypothetical protein